MTALFTLLSTGGIYGSPLIVGLVCLGFLLALLLGLLAFGKGREHS